GVARHHGSYRGRKSSPREPGTRRQAYGEPNHSPSPEKSIELECAVEWNRGAGCPPGRGCILAHVVVMLAPTIQEEPMPKVCLLLADGFEEIEAVTLIDVLRRAEVEVTTLGLHSGPVSGAHGIALVADAELSKAAGTVWDAVLLPGGMPGATHLRDH